MSRIRLNLRKLSVTDKIAKGRQIVTAMTNNASFPSPNPSLTDVTVALDDLAKANALVQAAKSEVTTRVTTQIRHSEFIDKPSFPLLSLEVCLQWLTRHSSLK